MQYVENLDSVPIRVYWHGYFLCTIEPGKRRPVSEKHLPELDVRRKGEDGTTPAWRLIQEEKEIV